MRGTFIHIVGTRPNFVKLKPLHCEMSRRGWPQKIVHTGQHSSFELSEQTWRDLKLPPPYHILRNDSFMGERHLVGAKFDRLSQVLTNLGPSAAAVIVYGDCDTAFIGAWSAKRLNLKVVHVEAGLRCGDMTMKEEQNRIMVDCLSDILFAPTYDAIDNLSKEGLYPKKKIVLAGNVMIDCLKNHVKYPRNAKKTHTLLTLHRPVNVDNGQQMKKILDIVNAASRNVIFPVHPHAGRTLEELKTGKYKNIEFTEPQPYSRFIGLLARSKLIITDSGGCQEEAGWMGIPCITFRESTERPITLSMTNRLAATFEQLKTYLRKLPDIKEPILPAGIQGWNGDAAVRICDALESEFK